MQSALTLPFLIVVKFVECKRGLGFDGNRFGRLMGVCFLVLGGGGVFDDDRCGVGLMGQQL